MHCYIWVYFLNSKVERPQEYTVPIAQVIFREMLLFATVCICECVGEYLSGRCGWGEGSLLENEIVQVKKKIKETNQSSVF